MFILFFQSFQYFNLLAFNQVYNTSKEQIYKLAYKYIQNLYKIYNSKSESKQKLSFNSEISFFQKVLGMKKSSDQKAQKKLINDFCSMTGASQIQANNFLKRANWNYQNAVNLFFDEGAVGQQKEIKQVKEIDDLFKQLSAENPKNKILQIDEQKFSEFVQKYFQIEDSSLIVGHLLINIMKVQRSGHITRENFYNLFQSLRCQSPRQLKKHVQSLHQDIYSDPNNFKSLYIGIYFFYLTTGSTTLQYETAVQIWRLYLEQIMHKEIYNKFMQYCNTAQKKPSRVHKDLWRMVYQFGSQVKNIDKVKEDDGWPVFLDQFVQWARQTNKIIEIGD